MKFNPDIHHRRSIRLPEYDYSGVGSYFITLCIQHRYPLLGYVADACMVINDGGSMVEAWWKKLPEKFHGILLDEYMIMPNHMHGIIQIYPGPHTGVPLHKILQWFKTMTTNEYIQGVNQNGWPAFNGKFWQRNYYERVIRDETELSTVREYIRNNPQQWEIDEMYVPS